VSVSVCVSEIERERMCVSLCVCVCGFTRLLQICVNGVSIAKFLLIGQPGRKRRNGCRRDGELEGGGEGGGSLKSRKGRVE